MMIIRFAQLMPKRQWVRQPEEEIANNEDEHEYEKHKISGFLHWRI